MITTLAFTQDQHEHCGRSGRFFVGSEITHLVNRLPGKESVKVCRTSNGTITAITNAIVTISAAVFGYHRIVLGPTDSDPARDILPAIKIASCARQWIKIPACRKSGS